MTKEIEIAPARQEQGENKQSHDYNGFENIKNYPFDIPDTLPGCYQEYKGEGDCVGCLYRLPCARMSAGGHE